MKYVETRQHDALSFSSQNIVASIILRTDVLSEHPAIDLNVGSIHQLRCKRNRTKHLTYDLMICLEGMKQEKKEVETGQKFCASSCTIIVYFKPKTNKCLQSYAKICIGG